MIAPAERAGFFQRENIGWLFDDAEQLDRARRIGANVAELVRREVAAKFTRMNPAARFGNGARDLFGLIAARLHHPERDPLGRARTDSRHLSKLCDQIPQRGWIFRFSHIASPTPGRFAPRTRALLMPASLAFRLGSARAA